MSNPNPNNPMAVAKREAADFLTASGLDAEVAKVLPKHITPERMMRGTWDSAIPDNAATTKNLCNAARAALGQGAAA